MAARSLAAIALFTLFVSIADAQTSIQSQISVASSPAGATVSIDGREIGTTPIVDYTIDPGRRRLRVELTGYAPYEEWLFFSSGAIIERSIVLQVRTGTIAVETDDALDGDFVRISVGSRSYSGPQIELPIGRYDLTIAAFGHESVRTTVTVRADETTPVAVRLKPIAPSIVGDSVSPTSLSPRSVPPFDRVSARFHTDAPAEYEVLVGTIGSRRSVVASGWIDSPEAVFVEWRPPTADAAEYEIEIAVSNDLGEARRLYRVHVAERNRVVPRVLTIRGRGTSLVRIPAGGETRMLDIGSGVYGSADEDLHLPVRVAFSFSPIDSWEATIAASAAADADGASWSAVGAGALSAPPYYAGEDAAVHATTTVQLSGRGGTGRVGPWNSSEIEISAPSSLENAVGSLGLAIEPGALLDLSTIDTPTLAGSGGVAAYFQTADIFLSAGSRVVWTFDDEPSYAVAADGVARLSDLPALLSVAVLAWEDLSVFGVGIALSFLW